MLSEKSQLHVHYGELCQEHHGEVLRAWARGNPSHSFGAECPCVSTTSSGPLLTVARAAWTWTTCSHMDVVNM